MAITREDIIEDLERHIRKSGGELSAWCAGTAKDARAPFFERHLAAELGDGLSYHEAYTTSAAAEVIEHLVNKDGLRLDRDRVTVCTGLEGRQRVAHGVRSCEKIKTAHAKSQRHKEAQSGTPFFALRPLRTLRLCVKPIFLSMH